MQTRLFISNGATWRRGSVTALAVLAAVVGCGPKNVQTAPAPAPVRAPAPPPTAAVAPTVSQTCPGETDGPSIVINALTEAHRVWTANPAGALPPVCLFTAFGRIAAGRPDSLVNQALALADESRRRGAEPPTLLAAEVMLYASAKRYQDVSRTYIRLVAADSTQATLDVSKIAIAAAHKNADTAALLGVLARAAANPAAGASITTENNVLRQTARLWMAIQQGKGLVKQNPKYVAAYPSIITNFGTLGLSDSVNAYVRIASAQGVPRATLTPAMETVVAAMLRHAALYGEVDGWDNHLAAARRVDSTLSSASTKFLVAALVAYTASARIGEIAALVGDPQQHAGDPAVRARDEQNRAVGCQRIAPLSTLLDTGESQLRNGGAQYTGANAAPVMAAFAEARTKLGALQDACSGA